MPTCNKGPTHTSTCAGYPCTCECIADNTYLCNGKKMFDAGSAASSEHIIQKQNEARARSGLPAWAPWVLGGLAVGGVAWLAFRK